MKVLFPFAFFLITSCSGFLDVDPPKSKIESSVVFADDVTATAVVLGIYSDMLSVLAFSSGSEYSISSLSGLSSDELVNNPKYDMYSVEFEETEVKPNNVYVKYLWVSLYKAIYQANTVIEGIQHSDELSESVKSQLLGEVFFIRAFCNFYLINLFGDIPLTLSTDYKVNSAIGRTDVSEVYDQILSDLAKAGELLSSEYAALSNERIRPNRFSAFALSARVYLYLNNWSMAEEMSTNVIQNSEMYNLEVAVDEVFLKNSSESIWQLRPISDGNNGSTNEASVFSPDNVAYYNVINDGFMSSTEPGDMRINRWIDTLVVEGDTIFYPCKYKQDKSSEPLAEYSMVLRLAEQYLIRAEARAMQDKLEGDAGALSDINAIRRRAGLLDVHSVSKLEVLSYIDNERRIELVTEWGHRWFDLKRRNKAEEVLSQEKELFTKDDKLYPIPDSEFLRNPRLVRQNPGY
ncbi:RagB/SusD family nutrient uptake outer membrane protein [Parachryseolinea silvisoli]|uniref:RagB/SusD family nutrient uptake outer membrane protein n=1 Tax=Parachryseolinea silvisoli TaxID=2873601 RepID=UPI0022658029|nr:RagB/SusD family nutrient uptake outer membrane protein [Parachryseolinea silvisoli]MCD9018890.1 RagB/SusD family nutrient uptake outer membrane protein [Parachryseolinea silvisoli]